MKIDIQCIEKLFDTPETHPSTPPAWADELLREIRSLKQMLTSVSQQSNRSSSPVQHSQDYYEFVKNLRSTLMPNPMTGDYPEVMCDGRRLGITNKGLLYDKSTGNTLERTEAFNAYKSLYNQHRRTPLF